MTGMMTVLLLHACASVTVAMISYAVAHAVVR